MSKEWPISTMKALCAALVSLHLLPMVYYGIAPNLATEEILGQINKLYIVCTYGASWYFVLYLCIGLKLFRVITILCLMKMVASFLISSYFTRMYVVLTMLIDSSLLIYGLRKAIVRK